MYAYRNRGTMYTETGVQCIHTETGVQCMHTGTGVQCIQEQKQVPYAEAVT